MRNVNKKLSPWYALYSKLLIKIRQVNSLEQQCSYSLLSAELTSLISQLKSHIFKWRLTYQHIQFGFYCYVGRVKLAINAGIFFRLSGALFNPAISLALALAQAIHPVRAILLSVSQILGGIVAAALIDALMPGELSVSTSSVEESILHKVDNLTYYSYADEEGYFSRYF